MPAIQTKMEKLRQVRRKTGFPIVDCKWALHEADGDVDMAVIALRRKHMGATDSRSGKSVPAGIIALYNHGFGRIGVMVEVRCETDFVAKSTEFQRFANAVAIHIAWASPTYISRSDIPEENLKVANAVADTLCTGTGTVEIDKFFLGFFSGCCLLDQLEQKESKATMTIGQMLEDLKMKMGEDIRIIRFSRYEMGDVPKTG